MNEVGPAREARGADGHRVRLKFDGAGGPFLTLVHPAGGCEGPFTCGVCGTFPEDSASKRCRDCNAQKSHECWLQGWCDNMTADELLHGSIEVPVVGEWDGDTAILHIAHPDEGLLERAARDLVEALEIARDLLPYTQGFSENPGLQGLKDRLSALLTPERATN